MEEEEERAVHGLGSRQMEVEGVSLDVVSRSPSSFGSQRVECAGHTYAWASVL